MKRSPLRRRTPLRTRASHPRHDPARDTWKLPVSGFCQCGCNPPTFATHLERHHVIALEHCKLWGLPLWDLRNSMLLASLHHARHTTAHRRIPVEAIPVDAVLWGVEQLGVERAALYLDRYYDCAITNPPGGRIA